MTTTSYKVVCECGHEGAIKLKENDQPYSASFEKYTLENLDGESYEAFLMPIGRLYF